MIRAIIFDFDGLILETEEPVFRSWQELYRAQGGELSFEDYSQIIGQADGTFDPFYWLEQQVGHIMDRQTVETARRQHELEMILAQPLLPKVEETLDTARRLRLRIGLASSSDHNWVFGHLQRLGLRHYFEVIKTSSDVQRSKPDPELYLAVLDEFGLQPREALAFEDSPNGLLAAKRAGITCVVVPNVLTCRLNLEGADLRLDSLPGAALEELIRRNNTDGLGS